MFMRFFVLVLLVVMILIGGGMFPEILSRASESPKRDGMVLADFSQYPDQWTIKGDKAKAEETYQVIRAADENYLRAVVEKKPARIFKKIAWDAKAYPIVEWKWRIKKWPEGDNVLIYLYVSLDKDIFGIPTLIKYGWSRDPDDGAVKGGGFFRPVERVIRTGSADSGEWMTERIDALADFQEMAGRDPKDLAYGIGILVESGIEAEFGPISVHPKSSDVESPES